MAAIDWLCDPENIGRALATDRIYTQQTCVSHVKSWLSGAALDSPIRLL